MGKNKSSRRNAMEPNSHILENYIKERIVHINAAKEFLKNRTYDRNDNDYLKRISKSAIRRLNETASEIRKTNKNSLETYKCTDCYLKRRQSAITEYVPFFAEKYEALFPDAKIEESLIDFCTQRCFFVPDDFKETYIPLALAIAILDKLYNSMIIWDILPYIPNSEELLSEIEIPENYHDSLYDNNLIKGMMYLIIHRDDTESVFYNPESVKRTKQETPVREHIELESGEHLSTAEKNEIEAARYKDSETMSCREKLDTILSIINPEVFEKSEQVFKDKASEFIKIILSDSEPLDKTITDYVSEFCDICNRTYLYEMKMLEHAKSYEKKKMQNPRMNSKSYRAPIMINNISSSDFDISTLNSFSDSSVYPSQHLPADVEKANEMIKRVNKLYDEIEKNQEKQKKVFADKEFYYVYAANYYYWKYNVCENSEKDKIIAKTMETVEKFSVDDPYEIFFGFFSLLESGDNIVWLLPLAGVLLSKAAEKLPWVKTYNPKLCEHKNSLAEEKNDTHSDDATDNDDSENIDTDVMYDICYNDYYRWASNGIKYVRRQDLMQLNLVQLIYRQTGLNIARKINFYEGDSKSIVKSGISKKNIDLMRIIFETCHHVSYRIKPYEPYSETTSKDDTANNDVLKRAISARDNEITQLKAALHKAENDLKNERENNLRIKADADAERRELTELRELIYNIQNDSNENVIKNEETISLPYTVKSNIVIFGGHDSWLKALRLLVKNVRIIEPSTNPDINLIRNADVVWMQSNAMPHSYYYKIMDIARQRKIPVKYFAYASAEKCARQLATEDITANK